MVAPGLWGFLMEVDTSPQDRWDLLNSFTDVLVGGISREADEMIGPKRDEIHAAGRVLLSVPISMAFGKVFSEKVFSLLSDVPNPEFQVILGRFRKNGIIGKNFIRAEWLEEECEYGSVSFCLDALCGAGEVHRLKDSHYVHKDHYKPEKVERTYKKRISKGGGMPPRFTGIEMGMIRKEYREGLSYRRLAKKWAGNRNTILSVLHGRGIYSEIECEESPIDKETLWKRKTRAKLSYSEAGLVRKAAKEGESVRSLGKKNKLDDKSIQQIIDGKTYKEFSIGASNCISCRCTLRNEIDVQLHSCSVD